MPSLFLIHWNPEEAEAMAESLRAAGLEVTVEAHDGGRASKQIAASPPDAVIISLARLPSHGRAVAEHLVNRPATRALPLFFVDGSPDAVALAQKLAPSATCVSRAELRQVLTEKLSL